MARPFVLVQLSDPHIGADWGGGDPSACLAEAVASVVAMRPQPDAVVVTGDLADHAADAEYEELRALLEPLGAATHVLPGNHDARRALHRHFGTPGRDGEAVQYAVDLGPLRLVVLDTTRPGEDAGSLGEGRLDWLEDALAAAPEQPALIALHHPPLVTGVPVWDEYGLAADDRRALGEVVARHPQVRAIAGGHVHHTITASLAGRPVLSVPSTYVQARLTLGGHDAEFVPDPPGFAVHVLLDGDLVSYVVPVT